MDSGQSQTEFLGDQMKKFNLSCPLCFNLQNYMLMRLKDLDHCKDIYSRWVSFRAQHAGNALARFFHFYGKLLK
jgi:hypothetical protein